MLPDAAQALWKSLRKTDRVAAQARVEALRKRMPDAPVEELHRMLVQSKCLQTGAVGALATVAELVPGVGKIAGVFIGPIGDAAMVTAMQAELVVETFAVYRVELGEAGERLAILAIAATNVGAMHASSLVAKLLTRYTGKIIGGFVFKRALPVARIATVATKNIALTYSIGMRTQAVARFRDAELDEWPKLMRQVTNIDERTLVEWATSAARTAIDQVQDSAKSWVGRITGLLPNLPDLRKFVSSALIVPPDDDGDEDPVEAPKKVPGKRVVKVLDANPASKAAVRKASVPKASVPKASAPKASAPKASAPKASAPKASAPKASAPKASAPAGSKRTKSAATGQKTAKPRARSVPK